MNAIEQAIEALQAARMELTGWRIETKLADAEAALRFSRGDNTDNKQLLERTAITFVKHGEKFVFCKNGVYFSLTIDEFDVMREALDKAAAQSQEHTQ